jgi:hypothetical protein
MACCVHQAFFLPFLKSKSFFLSIVQRTTMICTSFVLFFFWAASHLYTCMCGFCQIIELERKLEQTVDERLKAERAAEQALAELKIAGQ